MKRSAHSRAASSYFIKIRYPINTSTGGNRTNTNAAEIDHQVPRVSNQPLIAKSISVMTKIGLIIFCAALPASGESANANMKSVIMPESSSKPTQTTRSTIVHTIGMSVAAREKRDKTVYFTVALNPAL